MLIRWYFRNTCSCRLLSCLYVVYIEVRTSKAKRPNLKCIYITLACQVVDAYYIMSTIRFRSPSYANSVTACYTDEKNTYNNELLIKEKNICYGRCVGKLFDNLSL